MSVTNNQTATRNTHPHSVHCDKPGCWWRTAHSTYDQAVRIDATHPCPYDPVKRKYMTGVHDERGVEYTKPSHGQSLMEKAWDELDKHLDALMEIVEKRCATEADDPYPRGVETGWCQGLAWTIHNWCSHWFPTVEDVTREAVKRREIRLGQRPFEPTPGYKWNPMPGDHPEYSRVHKEAYTGSKGTPSRGQAATKKVAAKKAAAFTPTESDIEAIKSGLEMGVDADELAKMLGVPANIVKSYA